MENVNNFIRISSNSELEMSLEGDFFRAWTEFMTPLHHLTKRESDVLAAFLKERYELGKVIVDQEVLDSVLMSEETKKKIRLSCKVSSKHFQVIMSAFRRNGVLQENKKINPLLIPYVEKEGVGLMIYFDFNNEQFVKLGPQENKQDFWG